MLFYCPQSVQTVQHKVIMDLNLSALPRTIVAYASAIVARLVYYSMGGFVHSIHAVQQFHLLRVRHNLPIRPMVSVPLIGPWVCVTSRTAIDIYFVDIRWLSDYNPSPTVVFDCFFWLFKHSFSCQQDQLCIRNNLHSFSRSSLSGGNVSQYRLCRIPATPNWYLLRSSSIGLVRVLRWPT